MSWHYYFPLFLYGTEEYVWWQRELAHRLFGPGVFGGAAAEVNNNCFLHYKKISCKNISMSILGG